MTQINEPEQVYTDENGNLLAATYIDNNGDFRVHHAASGEEWTFKQDGTLDVPALSTDEASITEGSARIEQTTSQTIPTNDGTAISFDSEDTSQTTGDVLTVDLSNDKITIEKSGRFIITGALALSSPGDGTQVQADILLDGTIKMRSVETTGANNKTSPPTLTIAEIGSAPVDVTMQTYHNAGGDVDTTGFAAECNLSVGKIG